MSLALPTQRRRTVRLAGLTLLLVSYVAGAAALLDKTELLGQPKAKGCEARGSWFYCDGERFVVKGVGWDPTRPGEYPWDDVRTLDLVRSDFERIRQAGFNTVRSWGALTAEELSIAEENGLRVLQGIWIDPRGDFADPSFRSEQLSKVRRVVGYSSERGRVLGYLVINEPDPAHLHQVGLDESKRFLRDVIEAAHEVDPGALVSFASWPGLEFFDLPEMDFVAVNLYPVRPQALLDAMGYDGLVRTWKALQALQRPLVVSEYGLSVASIERRTNRPGGWSEAEQAVMMPQLAESIVRNGAAGGVAFMWIDGWWKNNDGPGDEMSHDPLDAEEWFGLHAMEDERDPTGRARPALAAMERWNRAILIEPAQGTRAKGTLEIQIFSEEQLPDCSLFVSVDGGEQRKISVQQKASWLRGSLDMKETGGKLEFTLRSRGRLVREWHRVVQSAVPDLTLSLSVQKTDDGAVAIAMVRNSELQPVAGASVYMAVSEARHRTDRFERVTADEDGVARFPIALPPDGTQSLAVAALRETAQSAPVALQAVVVDGGPIQ